MKDVYSIIERPLLTEKTMDSTSAGKYTFRVAKDANKIEIGQAVEKIFSQPGKPINVVKVNTISVKGKKRRVGRFKQGSSSDWKKAIVTLAEGQSITLFEGL
jgi:large subunit ribosomal protein L23